MSTGATASTETTAATGTGGREGTAATTAAGPAPHEEITVARARIDSLDERIIALVQERRAVSARIQQARIDTGGRRVHLTREMEILGRYRAELGRPGTQLAMTLLGLCRGRL